MPYLHLSRYRIALLVGLPILGLLLSITLPSCTQKAQEKSLPSLRISLPQDKKFVLLPIQESQPEVQVTLITGKPTDVAMDVRLAVDSIDYYVPMDLSAEHPQELLISGLADSTLLLKSLSYADTFDPGAPDYYRPDYHHTPSYGWMNDPNGLFFKDGVYHLYYQYNPYGSKWGNMHWGHSTSTDLVHWEQQPLAIARDTLGHIFSGSAVVDQDNTAGFGKGAVIAFYTAHQVKAGKQWQAQCLAYSTDNGKTYTKYPSNPILLPEDGVQDFRDPKVFWYEPARAWYMIVSADVEMRFYRSDNLRDWSYVSSFGRGFGAEPNQFECPDFFELMVDGNPTKRKWVMIVNINPGCLFGGSATEYFVGNFDGTTFTPDTPPSVAKWLDYGKDHYAFVTFSGTEGRVVGLPWVSNWQYANLTPYRQSRGMNGLPRELSLFTAKDGGIYLASKPAPEISKLERTEIEILTSPTNQASVESKYPIHSGTTEIVGSFRASESATSTSLILANDSTREQLIICFDWQAGKVYMDRTQSGITAFGKEATPHERETNDNRKRNSINYKDDFALATWAPLHLLSGGVGISHEVRIFIDKSSVELFVDGGRIAMTNLVFPTKPYNLLKLRSNGGDTQFTKLSEYPLSLSSPEKLTNHPTKNKPQ